MTPPAAHINAIGLAAPPFEVHDKFLDYASNVLPNPRERALFRRMAGRSGIARRRSVLAPDPRGDRIDAGGFYREGAFPPTSRRTARFAEEAPPLGIAAVEDLSQRLGAGCLAGVTHLLAVTCTGFTAPGLDLAVMRHFGIDPGVERTQVGFMGCNAAFNGLKLARHIVRSEPRARVLVLNLELCTPHLQPPRDVEEAPMFLLFADGAAAALVTADAFGLSLDRSAQTILPGTEREITWSVGDQGFDMHLSGQVPRHVGHHLPAHVAGLLGQTPLAEIDLWAVHPGGRTVLDAVQDALELPDAALATSRAVLREHGTCRRSRCPSSWRA
jgi:predicted naringenin-chalcone synthase